MGSNDAGRHSEGRRGSRQEQARVSAAAVEALVAEGLVAPGRAERAREVLDRVGTATVGEPPLRRRLAEVAGYVGGALVVAAVVVFLAQEWPGLSTTGRALTLAGIALVLYAAGTAVVLLGTRLVALRPGTGPQGLGEEAAPGLAGDGAVRRRLAGTLYCGGAVAVASTAAVLVEAASARFSSAPAAVAGLVLVAAALVGYVVAPTALGQLTTAAGAAMAIGAGTGLVLTEPGDVPFGAAMATVGVVWVLLAERGAWRERVTGLVLGCAFVLVGVQIPALGDGDEALGYLATAAVGVLAVVLYTRRRAIPYLVTAVAATTLAVPEALLDWTDGSLGPVGALLAVGVTLLVASMLGLRLRQGTGGAGPRAGTTG